MILKDTTLHPSEVRTYDHAMKSQGSSYRAIRAPHYRNEYFNVLVLQDMFDEKSKSTLFPKIGGCGIGVVTNGWCIIFGKNGAAYLTAATTIVSHVYFLTRVQRRMVLIVNLFRFFYFLFYFVINYIQNSARFGFYISILAASAFFMKYE